MRRYLDDALRRSRVAPETAPRPTYLDPRSPKYLARCARIALSRSSPPHSKPGVHLYYTSYAVNFAPISDNHPITLLPYKLIIAPPMDRLFLFCPLTSRDPMQLFFLFMPSRYLRPIRTYSYQVHSRERKLSMKLASFVGSM
jgi:hypothetical protein